MNSLGRSAKKLGPLLQKARLRRIHFSGGFLGAFDFLGCTCCGNSSKNSGVRKTWQKSGSKIVVLADVPRTPKTETRAQKRERRGYKKRNDGTKNPEQGHIRQKKPRYITKPPLASSRKITDSYKPSGTGDSQRDSRESIRANHSQLNPYFYSASGRFARITRISDSRESPDSRESCESIRANHATKLTNATFKSTRLFYNAASFAHC